MLSTTVLLAASMVVGQEAEQRSTHEDLLALEPLIGTWIHEVTAENDWSKGGVKAGDTTIVRTVYAWEVHGNGIMRTRTRERENGEVLYVAFKELMAWDTAGECVVAFRIGLTGRHSHSKWTRKENSWLIDIATRPVQGEPFSRVNKLTVHGDTLTLQALKRDGVLVTQDPITYERVKTE